MWVGRTAEAMTTAVGLGLPAAMAMWLAYSCHRMHQGTKVSQLRWKLSRSGTGKHCCTQHRMCSLHPFYHTAHQSMLPTWPHKRFRNTVCITSIFSLVAHVQGTLQKYWVQPVA